MDGGGQSSVPENLKSRLRDSYDVIAEAYTSWSIDGAAIRLSYLDKLLDLLPPSHRDILDVGCGAGIPTNEKLLARDPRFHITANDLSPAQIELGKKRLDLACRRDADRVAWLQGDMMSLDFPDAAFDVVLGFYCIQHLPRDEQAVMIRKVAAWLRPGGYMLVNFPAEDNENVVMTGWMGEKGWVYYSGWDADRYTQLLREAGLQLVLDEVRQDNVKAEFLWVIAKRPDIPTT
ncbi:putative methyltransferase [Diaporthe ampelina]|uniref:Putative methyltransferase n=1 Tax=Diaporthe ampelina TaxID=1214573 RepID=A0A0G2HSJ3_9PEZI|nr:putative methyltransferase [Diaporthe ampelina]